MDNNNIDKTLKSRKLLAQERTVFANERNTLAYIRTGFSSFVLSIAAIKLFDNNILFTYIGWIAFVVGLVLIIIGVVYYPIRKRRIKSH
ncbi:MAG: DUF202 domain-containing protein [Parcubacteria group bacterium]